MQIYLAIGANEPNMTSEGNNIYSATMTVKSDLKTKKQLAMVRKCCKWMLQEQ